MDSTFTWQNKLRGTTIPVLHVHVNFTLCPPRFKPLLVQILRRNLEAHSRRRQLAPCNLQNKLFLDTKLSVLVTNQYAIIDAYLIVESCCRLSLAHLSQRKDRRKRMLNRLSTKQNPISHPPCLGNAVLWIAEMDWTID